MSEPEPDNTAPELRPDTTIIRLQDPNTGKTIVLAIRINGGTMEAVVVSEPH